MAIASSGKGGSGGGGDLAALQQLLAASGSSSSGSGRVYMGQTYGQYGPHGGSGSVAPQRKPTDLWASEDEAAQDFYTWNTKKQADFLSKGVLSGMLKIGDGPLEAGKLWKKLVKEAALYGAAGKKVSPFDLMASYVQASGGANAWKNMGVWEINTQTGERRYTGPGTYLGNGKAQMVDTRVDLTDPDTAKAVATKLFQDLMGRDPGAGELTNFASALHSAEQNNPVVATTTTQYDMDTGQQLSSSTTSSGGVSAEGKQYIGEQQVKKKKEYGAFQAATTYANALESLVFGSPE
ncbi:hypothetical protein [Streptomyces sp. NPDC001843]|uniref:hypothetical protein n=1 Tax=Streptomyces sp. NPDC001843 TaxID=3364617 RepID=UPI0036BCEAC0